MPYLDPYLDRQDRHPLSASVLFSFPVCKLSASLPETKGQRISKLPVKDKSFIIFARNNFFVILKSSSSKVHVANYFQSKDPAR